MLVEEGIIAIIARAVLWVFQEIGYQIICYTVGCIAVKIVTLGKHPKNPSEHENNLSLLGLIILISPCLYLTLF